MTPATGKVLELHIFEPNDGESYPPFVGGRHIRSINNFLRRYFVFIDGSPKVNRRKSNIGIVHADGVYLTEAVSGTRAMVFAEMVRDESEGQ